MWYPGGAAAVCRAAKQETIPVSGNKRPAARGIRPDPRADHAQSRRGSKTLGDTMSDAKYTMITVAACAADFMADALPLTAKLAGELVDNAGSLGARAGVVTTGEHTGSLFLAQTYGGLDGIERAFDHYAASAAYAALIGSGKVDVTFRSILRLEDLGLAAPSPDAPGYLVLTRWYAPDAMTDRMRPMVKMFDDNGAMIMRYGTSVAGPNTGIRVLGVGYPSMDAIEKTYAALAASADYQAFVGDVKIVARDIVRVAG